MKRFSKTWTLLAITLIFLLLIPTCSKKHSESKEITFGHIAPLSGDAAIWGKWEKDGIDLAIAELNAKGGIESRKIRIIHEDDKADPKVAVSALQKLINVDNVKIVIGATLSSPTLACAPIAEKNKVILLSPSAQSPKISQAGDYIFRIFPTNADEGKHLAALAEKLKVQRTGVLYLNNDYGLGIRNILQQLLPKKGISIVAEERYDGDTKDFRTQLSKIKESSPQALFLLGYPTDMGIILVQIKELGIKTQVLAPNSFEAEEIIKTVKDAADGVIYVYPTIPDSNLSQSVRQEFHNKYESEMNVYNAMGYDAVNLLALAIGGTIKEKGELNTSYVKDYLYQIKEIPGMTGLITIDENGDAVDRPMEARIVDNGQSRLWK